MRGYTNHKTSNYSAYDILTKAEVSTSCAEILTAHLGSAKQLIVVLIPKFTATRSHVQCPMWMSNAANSTAVLNCTEPPVVLSRVNPSICAEEV